MDAEGMAMKQAPLRLLVVAALALVPTTAFAQKGKQPKPPAGEVEDLGGDEPPGQPGVRAHVGETPVRQCRQAEIQVAADRLRDTGHPVAPVPAARTRLAARELADGKPTNILQVNGLTGNTTASDAFAAELERIGVARGDRVALFMQNCPQYVVAFYAVLRADAVEDPLLAPLWGLLADPEFPAEIEALGGYSCRETGLRLR